MLGAGGGTSSYKEIETTDLIILWGSNARNAHPIFFHHLLKGVRSGAKMYAIDPRRSESAEWADTWLGIDVGSDIALANAVGREIIAAGLVNSEFVDHATSGFDAYMERWIAAQRGDVLDNVGGVDSLQAALEDAGFQGLEVDQFRDRLERLLQFISLSTLPPVDATRARIDGKRLDLD